MLDQRGAGFLFLNPDKEILVLKRSEICSKPKTWCLPGGRVDRSDYKIGKNYSESIFCGAERELYEETKLKLGYLSGATFLGKTDTFSGEFTFSTFIYSVEKKDVALINSEIKLDKEHTAWKWQCAKKVLSDNETHEGLVRTLKKTKLLEI